MPSDHRLQIRIGTTFAYSDIMKKLEVQLVWECYKTKSKTRTVRDLYDVQGLAREGIDRDDRMAS